MIRVTTGSRLHFGLLSLPSLAAARHWGGVGLMIQQPGWELTLIPSPTWSAAGFHSERALSFAQKLESGLAPHKGLTPCRIEIRHGAPDHAGLGSGTQLAMAVAQGLARVWNLTNHSPFDLATHLERGRRSALGIHGFLHGGLLVDGGKGKDTHVAPLVARAAFPENWPILLVLPKNRQGLFGTREQSAFANLHDNPIDNDVFTPLSRLVLLGLLPALHEQDFKCFSEALFEFNFKVGQIFSRAQGGIYAPPLGQELVSFLRQQGVLGVGQSSWGPTIFAVLDDPRHAELLASSLRSTFDLREDEVLITRARNIPAVVGRIAT